MIILHTLFCVTLALILGSDHLGFALENQPDLINNQNNSTIESDPKNNLEFLKKLFNERRKKHLGAVKNIKNVESYEQRYKMISLIIDEMVRIIESKKVIIERFNDELKKNSTTSLSDGTIKDALLSVCENTVLFGEIVLENPDITERILKKKSSSYEILKWSLTFVHENPLLLDQSTIKMLHLVFQELNLVTRMPNYSNPNWTTNMKKLSSKNINDNKYNEKQKKIKKKRKHGPQLVHIDL
ncbi:hypothetical protein PV328_001947 [Microctonus aethiopoides]|uniref:Uncharacterized protein n=1 Tax=Microctonus aethiopoides TaxID=144406 RepID=A0AA39KY12_9HYME|nr:hypothetical protein PV328_001947 [Microctonus aethiopoides]